MQKQKGISTLIGIIVIVVVAVILFGGVFTYQYYLKPEQNSEFFGSSQKTDQTQTQTSGWNTYTNTKYGFEIKVPVDEMISPNDVSMSESDFYMDPSYKQIFIVMQKGGCDLLVYPNIDDRFLSLIKKNLETTQLSILEHNGSKYYIGYRIVSHAVEPNECIPGLNRMLSTFKFITPADQTADWNTYTNTQYGFQFEYPKTWGAPSTSVRSAPSSTEGQNVDIFSIEGFYPGTTVNPFLEYYPINSKITLDYFIKGPWGHPSGSNPINVKIAGLNATKFEYETNYDGRGNYSPMWNVQVGFVDKNGGLFVINLGFPPKDKEQGISIFNKIISTFKFVSEFGN